MLGAFRVCLVVYFDLNYQVNVFFYIFHVILVLKISLGAGKWIFDFPQARFYALCVSSCLRLC